MSEAVDPNVIMAKWRERTAARGGSFLRHLDGKKENVHPSNLEQVHPFDAFRSDPLRRCLTMCPTCVLRRVLAVRCITVVTGS